MGKGKFSQSGRNRAREGSHKISGKKVALGILWRPLCAWVRSSTLLNGRMR